MHRARRPHCLRAAGAIAAAAALPAVARAASDEGLVLTPDPPLLLALILFFVALVLPVNRLVFKPLLRVLDLREERIAGARSKAEWLERQAADSLARYEQALRETRDEADGERRERLDQARAEVMRETGAARQEAEQRIEQARAEVGQALASARDALRSEARELARQAASQVLGRAL